MVTDPLLGKDDHYATERKEQRTFLAALRTDRNSSTGGG